VPDPRQAGERIAALLEEIESVSDARVRARAEELVRLLMELYGAGLERLLHACTETTRGESAATAERVATRVATRIADDELVSGLLALHGIHPIPTETRVRSAIEKVRPYLGSHGGDIDLVGIEDGEVVLRFKGSCDGCPSSALTMRNAIEGAIEEAAPEISGIRLEQPAAAASLETPLFDLGSRHAAARDDGAGESAADDARRGRSHWVVLDAAPALAPGETAGIAVLDSPILLCRLDEGLYAYRDRCPACDSAFAGGRLERHLLACPTCGHLYDIHRAGRSGETRSVLHLEPLPLLVDRGTVRISLEQQSAAMN